MKQEEINQKRMAKLSQIQSFMAALKVTVDAKQKVNQNGFIENTVLFTDNEEYPIDPEPTGETGPTVTVPVPEIPLPAIKKAPDAK